MIDLAHLLLLFEEFCRVENIAEKTLSSRLFGESKKIALLRGGQDLTTNRYNFTLMWLSEHWPSAARWPDTVTRPIATAARPEQAA